MQLSVNMPLGIGGSGGALPFTESISFVFAYVGDPVPSPNGKSWIRPC